MISYKRFSLTIVLFFIAVSIDAQKSLDYSIQMEEEYRGMDLEQKKFFVIAHRGASAYYPENTMSAFKGAVEMKADMIELDVMLSKDNVPVVFHDEKLDKKTNGSGNLIEFTLEELKRLDAGTWFNPKFKEERIPTLREVLEYCKGKILVNIEIKTEAVRDEEEGGIEELVTALVKELLMTDQVIISSFDYRVLERLSRKKNSIKYAVLYERQQSYGREPSKLVEDLEAAAFNMNKMEFADNWVQNLNRYKIPFFVYTINDPVLMRSMIKDGARGIFTDKPDVLNKVVEEVIIKKWQ